MNLITLPILLVVFAVGAATMALAAGNGGGAGGGDAQQGLVTGRAVSKGQAGPAGATNHPMPNQTQTPTTAGSADKR